MVVIEVETSIRIGSGRRGNSGRDRIRHQHRRYATERRHAGFSGIGGKHQDQMAIRAGSSRKAARQAM
jgi:hypothetical protein